MADDNGKQPAFCPNCQQPAIKQDNRITCEKCDAEFTITKTGAAKVKQVGRIEQIEKDIADIKLQLPGQEPEPAPGPGEDEGPPEASGESEDENEEW